MSTILVVEDDPAIRNNVVRLLQLEGHAALSAGNGVEGLERARALRPEVVITDANMPGMDGFALVQALRAEPALATTAVMMLTALDDRASMRRGMTAGADDYLPKPFTRGELLEALDGLLKKRQRLQESIESAVQLREDHLRRAFTASLGADAPADRFVPQAPAGTVAEDVLQATVLFSDIRGFTALAEKIGAAEVAELLTQYFDRAAPALLAHGGRHLKFIGDGLLAVFADDGPALPAARRAVSAALALVLVTHQFRDWLARRFADRGLPPFAIGAGLHCGEVSLCRLGAGAQKEITPIGDTVNTAARLEGASKELGWTVVASTAVLQAAGPGVQTGGVTALEVRGRHGWIEVAEVLGLEASPADRQHGLGLAVERAAEIEQAVRINSEITARAVKGALRSKLSAFKSHRFGDGGTALRLPDYRLTRKLAAGGMTEVYLGERAGDRLPVVLKVLHTGGWASSDHLARFIQEYVLLSRITNPGVIRIYDQGFTEDHAYIAMEYFERGDLRAELRAGMAPARALEVAMQVAAALDAIHAHGIVHRDLKPENIMLRRDGSVAVADFGVAKSLLHQDNDDLLRTRHGDVVGTPYYLSPEQAAGQPITPATDLYSLGVMLFEMLTGSRPFQAESLQQLLAHHLSSPVPRLPPPHQDLQPVIDRLMAKQPHQRYPSARALLADLRRQQLPRTLAGPA